MINWKAILIGSGTAIALFLVSSILTIFSMIFVLGVYFAIIIGGFVTGYMAGGGFLEGAKHGGFYALVITLVFGLISTIAVLIYQSNSIGSSGGLIAGGAMAIIIILIISLIFGSIFGGVGAAIKKSST